MKHLPGFVEHYDALKKGADEIVCLSVNDAFVMDAWGRAATRAARSACWPTATATDARLSASAWTRAVRRMGGAQRYAMILRDGKVEALMVEPGPDSRPRARSRYRRVCNRSWTARSAEAFQAERPSRRHIQHESGNRPVSLPPPSPRIHGTFVQVSMNDAMHCTVAGASISSASSSGRSSGAPSN